MRAGKIKTICFFLVLFSFCVTKRTLAQSTAKINEFLPHTSSNEWVEFYNPSHDDLSNYWLDDDTSFTDDSGSSPKVSLATLNNSNQDYPFIETSNFLNNGGDYVVLFSNGGTVVDQYQYTSDPGAEVTIGRSPDGSGSFFKLSSATKGGPNSAPIPDPTNTPTSGPTSTPTVTPTITQTPAPTQTPATYSNISITEFMANPDSGNEWVELYNNNDSEVNLYGWYLDDLANGGRSPQSISGTIPAKSYKQYFLDGYFLDNDGDDVRLLDGGQNEKDKKSYTTSTKGKSWSKDSSGNWCQTDPTPGAANPSCPSTTSTPTPKVTGSITPTPKITVTPSVKPTPTGEPEPTSQVEIGSNTGPLVLGEGITPTPAEALKAKDRFKVTASIFIGSGLVLLGISGFLLFKKKI